MAEEIPDIYCDSMQLMLSANDLVMELLKRTPSGVATQSPIKVGYVRISLEHAKALTIMLKTSLKQFEEQQGAPIPLHPQVRSALGISKNEDW